MLTQNCQVDRMPIQIRLNGKHWQAIIRVSFKVSKSVAKCVYKVMLNRVAAFRNPNS